MTEPSWPEWGSFLPSYHPWHISTGPQGDMHAGHLLDTVLGPDVATGQQRIYEVLRCEPCIAIHVTPLPAQDALAQYYAEQFYQQDKPDYIARYERDREWWEHAVHDRILDTCHAYLRRACPEEAQVRFLDIGAGPGIALDCAKRRGWETWGIEPNRTCCQRISHAGHYALQDTFGSHLVATFSRREPVWHPHVIYAYEVLEHQSAPDDFLLQCHEVLEERGLVVIVVPNEYTPLQRAARATLQLPPYWLAPPQHLFYWTPKTLQLALRRAGFELCDMRGTFAIDKFLTQGLNYIGHDDIGRMCHAWRMQDELSDVTHGRWPQREQEYRENLAQRRIGREIIAVGRKTLAHRRPCTPAPA